MDKLFQINNKLLKIGNSFVVHDLDTGLYYSDLEETVGTAINKQFSININNNPNYIVAKFDWKANRSEYGAFCYNRNCCGAKVRCHYQGYEGQQPVITTNNYTSTAFNESRSKQEDSTTNLYAINTVMGTYSTVKYIWDYNNNGFSAYVNDVWRFKGEKETDFSNFGNFTLSNEIAGVGASTTYLKNLQIGWFSTLSGAERW